MIIKRAFFDTSSISQLVKTFSDKEQEEFSYKYNLSVVIGQHVSYEICKIFLDPDNSEHGKKLIRGIQRLSPHYTCGTTELVTREISSYTTPTIDEMLPYLRKQLQECFQDLINSNTPNKTIYIKNINTRENNFNNYLEVIKNLELHAVGDTLDQFICNIRKKPKIVRNMLQKLVNNINESRFKSVLASPHQYIATNLLIYCNLYHHFHSRDLGIKTKANSTGDHRNIIESSYCSYFVSDDKQQRKFAKKYHTSIKVLTLDELIIERRK